MKFPKTLGLVAITLTAIGLSAGATLAACSSDDTPPAVAADAGPTGTLAVACTDSIDAVYGPSPTTGELGTVLKCAPEQVWSAADLEAKARASVYPYAGKPFVSGGQAYRIAYRTERGTNPPTPGYSSALVFIPDAPSPNAPAVVVAHGTAGQGPSCAPSKALYGKEQEYFAAMVLPLVGAGYTVIAPDNAGYAGYGEPGNPPNGYLSSADEGKSVLDGLRAIRKLAPGLVSSKSIVVGHSQGGHAALSALAMSESYGVELSGVVAYAPVWFNQATWGALLAVSSSYPLATNAFPAIVGAWYHYSHGELLDGQGHGADIFAADKRAKIKELFDTKCLWDYETATFDSLGTYPADLYDPAFTESIKYSAAIGVGCNDDLCEKWVARYAADRPHFTGKATSVPTVIVYGTADTTVPPERATCGFARLKEDGVSPKYCVTSGLTHSSILGARSSYVNEWIANVTQGGPAPEPCEGDETLLVGDGGPVKCATPPSNN